MGLLFKCDRASFLYRWMAQNSDRIKNTPLLNLTLPGSHDSAAYDLNGHIMPGQLPWALRQLLIAAETLGLPPERYIIKWSEAQSLSLAEQLQNGIRFVDLRAGTLPLHPQHAIAIKHPSRHP